MPTRQQVTDGRAGHGRRHRGAAIHRPRDARRSRFTEDTTLLYERELKRLKTWIRVLSALLAASIAHVIVDGLTASSGFALGITAVLLAASLGLWRQGSRLTPGSSASRAGLPDEPPEAGHGARNG
jgi:hypothetical protein